MGLIEQSCAMARVLQPSIVVLEDVDLIAEERTREGACAAVLFELLNQMDGCQMTPISSSCLLPIDQHS